MPFSRLASLHKLGNLDAEVVAIAPDEKARSIAVFTSDPVQVAIYPIGSGTAKVKKVGLDAASDGALLDNKIALVKSGSDLWALLDIQHTPKIEQVGREVRSLCNNPLAEMVLSIGWDGQGHDLRNTGRDAEARSFVLRGDIRACSLDGVDCYVVVDGEGGGRFRVHPGATPESGHNQRCDLPAAAKGMSRLRGGRELSALCRRGGAEVCLIRREGAGLAAKMIGVPGAVADVAVLEQSLLVVGTDGVARLYDGAALGWVNDGGSPEPKHELALGLSGEPTVAATTSKGGNRLWVGSKGGDVVRCEAAKGEMQL